MVAQECVLLLRQIFLLNSFPVFTKQKTCFTRNFEHACAPLMQILSITMIRTYRVEGNFNKRPGPVSENTMLEFLTLSRGPILRRTLGRGLMLFRRRIFRLILMENLFGIHSVRSSCSLFLCPYTSHIASHVMQTLKC